MSNSLEYKGYQGVVEFSADDNVFFGKIFGINDLVTFEGDSVKQLEKSFHEAVEDYLAICRKMGKEPERPYKGNFNVRINPEIHRKAAFKAQSLNISLNELVENAIEKEVQELKPVTPEQVSRFKTVAPVKKKSSAWQKSQKTSSGKYGHKRVSASKKK
jgi:predicted HicB family RNase H-like nuclease